MASRNGINAEFDHGFTFMENVLSELFRHFNANKTKTKTIVRNKDVDHLNLQKYYITRGWKTLHAS